MKETHFILAVYNKVDDHLLQDYNVDQVKGRVQKILRLKGEDCLKIHHITEDQFLALSKLVPALLDLEYNTIELYYECFSK